ncbi:hypothetical protein C6P45_001902 [Maudiozyma exigua]|uniref:Uncharacterized protein n=1 Tax=Maudiozyma exigua TaxID=34358 RepID=A0A9P6VYY1_MAUEX|nr:hypothetical protein C6P45_001902 [Kazachstania exigua]
MLDYNLMYKANPLLFSPERYDQYPLDHEELMHYLTSALSSGAAVCPRPVTATDEFDYLLYRDDATSSSRTSANVDHLTGKNTMLSGSVTGGSSSSGNIELDLDKKLACEFAIYQTHIRSKSQQKKSKNRDSKATIPKDFNHLLQMKIGSDEWFEEMLYLLESINATNIDLGSLSGMSIASKDEKSINGASASYSGNKTDNVFNNDNNDTSMQETISYILSNSIKNGVDIKPQFKNIKDDLYNGNSSEKEYLRNIIDSVIEMAKNNRDNEKTNGKSEEDNEMKMKEMNMALNDLQLAHNFLTRQFENDRIEYSKDIEKLTKTNRELQEKLLNYHSNLVKTENELQETQEKLQMKELNPTIQGSNTPIFKGIVDDLGIMSPINIDRDNARSSQGSLDSKGEGKGSSYSLTLMRNEFKKLLTETQRKYEIELTKERELRKELEQKQAQ